MTTIEKIRKDNRFFLKQAKQLRAETIAAGEKVSPRLEGTIKILEVSVAHDEHTVKEWCEWLELVMEQMNGCFAFADMVSNIEMLEWFEGAHRVIEVMHQRAVDAEICDYVLENWQKTWRQRERDWAEHADNERLEKKFV